MVGINISKKENDLVIKWQMSKTSIPIKDITSIAFDNTYGGGPNEAVRIGTPYGTTDRLVIHTETRSYLLFTTNIHSLTKKIEEYTGMTVELS